MFSHGGEVCSIDIISAERIAQNAKLQRSMHLHA